MYNLNLCEDPTAARAHKGGWWAKDATEDSWRTENKASKKKEDHGIMGTGIPAGGC